MFSEAKSSDESRRRTALRFKTELDGSVSPPLLLSLLRVQTAKEGPCTLTQPPQDTSSLLSLSVTLGTCPSSMCHGDCLTHGYRALLWVYSLFLQISHSPVATPLPQAGPLPNRLAFLLCARLYHRHADPSAGLRMDSDCLSCF